MTTDPRSKVRPHAFERDAEATAGDYFARSWCGRCHLPGEPGDERHPVGARRMAPDDEALAEARQLDLRRLGERDDDTDEREDRP